MHKKLGIFDPDLSNVLPLGIFKRKKIEKYIYKLGKPVSTKSISKAVNMFVCREYPDGFEGVIFAPQIFFPKRPDIIESDQTNWTIEQTNKLKIQTGFIKGDESERCLFNKIKTLTLNKDDAVLVLNGFKTTDVETDGEKEKEIDGETDFVIASWKRKHIYIIESKYNPTKDVSDQLKRAKEYFEKYFGKLLEDWNIVLCVYFHTCKENVYFCEDCKPFVLTKDTNFSEWWTSHADHPDLLHLDGKTSRNYKLFKYLLFSQHAHKEPVSKAEFANKLHDTIISKIGKKENIILWSKEQFAINQNKDTKHLLIMGPFGSGKTILLKEKAKEVAKNMALKDIAKGVVHFLTLRQMHLGHVQEDKKVENNLQSLVFKAELEEFGVKVVFFWTVTELFNYIEENPASDHFFLDEFSLIMLSKVTRHFKISFRDSSKKL